jgi:hypothetical protein
MRHRTVDVGRVDELLAAVLRREATRWPWPSGGDEDAVLGTWTARATCCWSFGSPVTSMPAAGRFGTVIRSAVSAALAAVGRTEPVAAYVEAGWLRGLALDLGAGEGRADRLRYLRVPCLPPASYMLAKYAAARVTWLPWLYARRAVEGVRKRL